MSMNAILEPSGDSPNKRGASRLRIRVQTAGELEQGQQADVTIHNISASGILMETRSGLAVGQIIRIELPESDPVFSTVVWESPPLFGCRFHNRLSQAVLSAVQLSNPLPPEFDPVYSPRVPSDEEPLAARILRLRHARGLSRTELAAVTGLSKPSIWSWETGKSKPRHSNIVLLANALEVSVKDLLKKDIIQLRQSMVGDDDHPTDFHRQDISDIIEQSKNSISEFTGVNKENIKIIIEY